VKVATPLAFNPPVPSTVESDRNVTMPLGRPGCSIGVFVTVAVNVTGWVVGAVVVEATSAVAVDAGGAATVSDNAVDVEAANPFPPT
jgi:hypothetical protein